jgi:hypothetical protein
VPDIRKLLNCDCRKGRFGVRTIRGEAMPRPYFEASIKGLEALFEQHADDTRLLAALLDELEQRKTPKAISLKDRVVKRLAAKKAGADASNVGPTPRPAGPRQPELPLDTSKSTTREVPPDSSVNNNGAADDRGPGSAPKREISKIRKPGRLTDVPDARSSFTSNKIDLNFRRTLLLSKDISSLWSF